MTINLLGWLLMKIMPTGPIRRVYAGPLYTVEMPPDEEPLEIPL